MAAKKAIVSLSGGMDSTTVLAWMLRQGYDVQAVGFYYGSKHNPHENALAKKLAGFFNVPFKLLDISSAFEGFKSNLLQSGGAIPEGHYQAPNMDQTVVPGRNMIFMSILAGLAWSEGAEAIGVGIHQGDHAIYADCRVEFHKAMDSAIYLGTDRRVELVAPFLHTDKTGILEWGLPMGVPYELTRTCYKAEAVSCGKCGACQERLEAFRNVDRDDPIKYAPVDGEVQ